MISFKQGIEEFMSNSDEMQAILVKKYLNENNQDLKFSEIEYCDELLKEYSPHEILCNLSNFNRNDKYIYIDIFNDIKSASNIINMLIECNYLHGIILWYCEVCRN